MTSNNPTSSVVSTKQAGVRLSTAPISVDESKEAKNDAQSDNYLYVPQLLTLSVL